MGTQSLLTVLLVLCGGIAPGLTAAVPVYTVTEGGQFRFRCLIYEHGTTQLFCKNDCGKEEDILVSTSDERKQSSVGRFSAQFEKRARPPDVMVVSIADVESSDTGMYRCETRSGAVQGTSVLFQIHVTGGSKWSDSTTASPSAATSRTITSTAAPAVSSERHHGTTGETKRSSTPQTRGPTSPQFQSNGTKGAKLSDSTTSSPSTTASLPVTSTSASVVSSEGHNGTETTGSSTPQTHGPSSRLQSKSVALYVVLAGVLILLAVIFSFLYCRRSGYQQTAQVDDIETISVRQCPTEADPRAEQTLQESSVTSAQQ